MKNDIRRLRMMRDITQKALAEQVGVTRQAINTIENGKHDPSISLAYRIAGALGVPITEVFIDE